MCVHVRNGSTVLTPFRRYFSSAIRRIKDFSDKYGEAGVGEINTLCPAHVLTLDFDTEKTSGYCRAAVVDGKLTMLFTENNLGTNIDDALGLSNLEEALNTAPEPEGSKLSYHARRGIREEYEPEIEKITSEARELLKNDKLTFKPDFESLFEKLKASKEVDRSDWDTTLGSFLKYYFEGFVSTLKWQKFGEDELLQEGFNDVVDKNEVAFRVVDKLERKTYNEVVIEDGVVYIQVRLREFLFFFFSFFHLFSSTLRQARQVAQVFPSSANKYLDRLFPSTMAPIPAMLARTSWTFCR